MILSEQVTSSASKWISQASSFVAENTQSIQKSAVYKSSKKALKFASDQVSQKASLLGKAIKKHPRISIAIGASTVAVAAYTTYKMYQPSQEEKKALKPSQEEKEALEITNLHLKEQANIAQTNLDQIQKKEALLYLKEQANIAQTNLDQIQKEIKEYENAFKGIKRALEKADIKILRYIMATYGQAQTEENPSKKLKTLKEAFIELHTFGKVKTMSKEAGLYKSV